MRFMALVAVGLALGSTAFAAFYSPKTAVPGAPENKLAYRELSNLFKKVGFVRFDGAPATLLGVQRDSLTIHFQHPWNHLPEITLKYDDLTDPDYGADIAAPIHPKNPVIVWVKTSKTCPDARDKEVGFYFWTRNPRDAGWKYADAEGATKDAVRFLDDLNILIQDPSSRVDAYGEAYPAARDRFLSSGGKLELTEDARKFFVQAEGAFNEKNYDHAVEKYYQGLELAPWYPQAHYNLSILLAEQWNDYTEAVNEMKKFLELSPGSPDARSAQDKIYLWEDKAQAAPAPAQDIEEKLKSIIHRK
jgi:tetratricopeptide (TPR) repeat protein